MNKKKCKNIRTGSVENPECRNTRNSKCTYSLMPCSLADLTGHAATELRLATSGVRNHELSDVRGAMAWS